MEAKCIGRIDDRYGKYYDLLYKYRGKIYFVRCYYNGNAMGDSLKEQHIFEQKRIDYMLENKEIKEAKPIDFDEIWAMLEWD